MHICVCSSHCLDLIAHDIILKAYGSDLVPVEIRVGQEFRLSVGMSEAKDCLGPQGTLIILLKIAVDCQFLESRHKIKD